LGRDEKQGNFKLYTCRTKGRSKEEGNKGKIHWVPETLKKEEKRN